MKNKLKKSYYSKKNVNYSLRRKVSVYYRYITQFLKALFIIVFSILIFTKLFHNARESIYNSFAESLASIGFDLEHVVIVGQRRTTQEEILKALNYDVGSPMLSINLASIRENINNLPWVKNSIILRKLPNTIIIKLTEKEPIAIWQYNKNLSYIDSESNVIAEAKAEDYANFILVVGSGANLYAKELIDCISTDSDLASKILSAVRYGERRWNFNLKDNITVKMPQYNFERAWDYLRELNAQNKLFSLNCKLIDLRDENKYYIEKKTNDN